jgi:hypothetical protein
MARAKQTKRLVPYSAAVAARIAATHSPPTHGPPMAATAKKHKTTSKKMTNIKNDVVGKAMTAT